MNNLFGKEQAIFPSFRLSFPQNTYYLKGKRVMLESESPGTHHPDQWSSERDQQWGTRSRLPGSLQREV